MLGVPHFVNTFCQVSQRLFPRQSCDTAQEMSSPQIILKYRGELGVGVQEVVLILPGADTNGA